MKLNKQTSLFKTPRGIVGNFPKFSQHFSNFFIMKQSKISSFSRFGFQTIFKLSGDTSV